MLLQESISARQVHGHPVAFRGQNVGGDPSVSAGVRARVLGLLQSANGARLRDPPDFLRRRVPRLALPRHAKHNAIAGGLVRQGPHHGLDPILHIGRLWYESVEF